MDLLDRYLQAVRFWLPRAQQDDIVAELSEDIRSQIEEQENHLGRKLNQAEMEATLKQRGRPLLVANRYRPQQYLIGPLLFPVYRFVLILVFLCYLGAGVAREIGLLSFSSFYRSHLGAMIGDTWGTSWLAMFTAVGVVTIVFALLERIQAKSKFLENWNPAKLPPVRDPNRIPCVSSTVDLAANLVFIVWWLSGMSSQIVFDRAGVRIVFAPVWETFFWAFLLIAVANVALDAANLLRPCWTWLRAGVHLALTIAGSAMFCWLCKANILAEIVVPNLSSARAAHITNAINTGVSRSFPFAVLACVIIIGLSGVGRLIRLRTSRKRLIRGLAA